MDYHTNKTNTHLTTLVFSQEVYDALFHYFHATTMMLDTNQDAFSGEDEDTMNSNCREVKQETGSTEEGWDAYYYTDVPTSDLSHIDLPPNIHFGQSQSIYQAEADSMEEDSLEQQHE